jgi:plasmid maintenance system antidote protein VapI
MEGNELQRLFFQYIKSKLPSNISFAEEIADVLNLINDSAYRRIRGEKFLSLEELSKIATHFGVSVEQLLNLKNSNAKNVFRQLYNA